MGLLRRLEVAGAVVVARLAKRRPLLLLSLVDFRDVSQRLFLHPAGFVSKDASHVGAHLPPSVVRIDLYAALPLVSQLRTLVVSPLFLRLLEDAKEVVASRRLRLVVVGGDPGPLADDLPLANDGLRSFAGMQVFYFELRLDSEVELGLHLGKAIAPHCHIV